MQTTRLWASSLLLSILLLLAQIVNALLDKPALVRQGLSIFEDGLKANYPKGNFQKAMLWEPSWILADCKKFAERANLSATDIETYEVYYDDCVSPWVRTLNPDQLWLFAHNPPL